MVRLIKRYESRKLYDTEESKYVSLDQIGIWVREGQEVRVMDNASGDDVTAQTLTQIILEEGRTGKSNIPAEVLHELVRFGEKALTSGVEHVQSKMDQVVRASIDRLAPVRQAREEMTRLRARLEELEDSLAGLDVSDLERANAAQPGRTDSDSTASRKRPVSA